MTKIVIALSVLLLLVLAGNFGLVWAVVVHNMPTTVNSNVLTTKATGEPVQVSSADFFYDTNGLLQLRGRSAQVSMDWVGGPGDTCASDTCSSDAGGATGRRRLLQFTGSTASTSTPTTVAETTQFTPTCNFSSPDFYTNSTYFFTGTCTFPKLVQMRTVVLPMLPSKTTAQVGGGIIDAVAWKDGAQTVYRGCYNRAGSAMQNTLSASTTLANCEALALAGLDSNSRPHAYFGYTGTTSSTTGACYACSISNSACAPTQTMTCTATAGVQVFQVLKSPNRYLNAGPGPLGGSPIPIAGGAPAAPAWSFTTLVITRVDYVKNVFRDASNLALTVCQANLLRFYVAPMTSSGAVSSDSGGNSSYIDVCLTPMSKSSNPTWVGNYTVHPTGRSSVFSNTGTNTPAYFDRPSVTGFSTPGNTDFQSQLSYYCANCPSGPYIDYSNLQYDSNLFELPCTRKGISWKYRDVYSNQGCPAWDPANPSGQSNCTWTTAESSFYGGPSGLKYCILTMDKFTPDEPIYTLDNQLSFRPNTGRLSQAVQKTQTSAPGDTGVPPLYNYNSAPSSGLWSDYYYTQADGIAAVAGTPFFSSSRISATSIASSRRHLLADPTTTGVYTFTDGSTYTYVGDCDDKTGTRQNRWVRTATTLTPCSCGYVNGAISSTTCSPSTCVAQNLFLSSTPSRICRCAVAGVGGAATSTYCNAASPICKAPGSVTAAAYGCFSGISAPSASASILAS